MTTKTYDGFTEAERSAMKERSRELKSKAGEAEVLAKIAAMRDEDRVLAERLHAIVARVAPDLMPKTYYGMPAYANGEGKVVVFIQAAAKFKTRYATIGFEDRANLDDGDLWPIGFAVRDWTPAVEQRITELVRSAVS